MRFAIFRPDTKIHSASYYNSQEVGLAKALACLGVDVDIFTASDSGSITIDSIASGLPGAVELIKIPFYMLPELQQGIYPKLREVLRQRQYDLLQINEDNELTCWYAARVASKLGIPVIIYQGMYSPLNGRIQRIYQALFSRLCRPFMIRTVKRAFAKTDRANQYLRSLGYPDVSTVPVGLDHSVFDDAPDTNWNSKLNMPRETNIALYVGVFEKRRNIRMMLDIAEALVTEKISFVLVGEGPELQLAQETKSKRGLSNVYLPGRVKQEELASLYRSASVFLLPSVYEIYGMVILESMYFGTPVISSKTAGANQLINHGVDGVLIDNFEITEWVEAITSLIRYEGLSRMGEAAEKAIRQHYTWDRIAIQYLDELGVAAPVGK